jgi:glycosyltransferase involved in cell wall biosynthesis
MKISIVVPSFNYDKYIDACLKSILDQTYRNFEVLICDGGSIDSSLEIIKKYCDLDNRFRLISESDSGQSNALNFAFSRAKGEIFYFLNSDDLLININAFQLAIDSFNSSPQISIISFNGYYVDSTGTIIKKINLRYHPFDNIDNMKNRTAVIQPATFWKKKVYEKIKFKEKFEYSFDSVFFYQAYSLFNWLEVNVSICGYRWHQLNKSGDISHKRVKELSDFEILKFGVDSYRVFYLKLISKILLKIEEKSYLPNYFKIIVKFFVNSFSFLTVYRFPNI